MDVQTWLMVITVVLSVGSFFAGMYWNRKREHREGLERTIDQQTSDSNKQTAANGVRNGRIMELEGVVREMNLVVQPLSAAYQAMLIKQLTHYHTPVLDKLLQKLEPPASLTEDEEKQLIIGLEERTRDMGPEISELEREAAVMLPLVIKRVRAEQDVIASNGNLQVVVIPPAAEGKQL